MAKGSETGRIPTATLTGTALLLALGLTILANSRPYEGLAVSLPVAATLLVWMLGKARPPLRVSLGRLVLPVGLALGVAGAAMAASGAVALYHVEGLTPEAQAGQIDMVKRSESEEAPRMAHPLSLAHQLAVRWRSLNTVSGEPMPR